MAIKNTFKSLKTNKSMEEVMDATEIALRYLGGEIKPTKSGFEVINGTNGVNCAFVADCHAYVTIKSSRKKDNAYNILCQINYKPNTVFWLSLVTGFCLYLPWIANILFLFINPIPAYQQALDRIQFELE